MYVYNIQTYTLWTVRFPVIKVHRSLLNKLKKHLLWLNTDRTLCTVSVTGPRGAGISLGNTEKTTKKLLT